VSPGQTKASISRRAHGAPTGDTAHLYAATHRILLAFPGAEGIGNVVCPRGVEGRGLQGQGAGEAGTDRRVRPEGGNASVLAGQRSAIVAEFSEWITLVLGVFLRTSGFTTFGWVLCTWSIWPFA
jgi:hypothetical protein